MDVLPPAARRRVHDRHAGGGRHDELAVQAGHVEERRRRDDAGHGRRAFGLLPARGHRPGDRLRAAQHRHLDEVQVAAVREQGALRPPGGAAREQDEERVVLGDGDVRERGRLRLEGGEVVLEHDDGQVGVDGLVVEPLDPSAVAEQDLGAREPERVRHLGAGPPPVHRDRDRPDRGGSPERDRVLDAVRGRDRDAVALHHPVLLGERARHCRHRSEHVGVRERPVGEDDVRTVPVALRCGDEQLAQVPVPPWEHLQLRAEDVFGRQLERGALARERVADRVGKRRVGPGQSHGRSIYAAWRRANP